MAVSQTLTLEELDYSVSDNTSLVRVLWQSTQTGPSFNLNTRVGYCYYTVNGGEEAVIPVSYTLPANTTQTILDMTLEIPHQEDGSGYFWVHTWMDTRISAGEVDLYEDLFLTDIPRASTITFPDFTFGEPGNITVHSASADFTHAVSYRFGNEGGTVTGKTASTVIPWTPPLSLLRQIPDSPIGQGALTVSTYSGDTLVGSNSYLFRASAGAEIKPSCSFTWQDISGCAATFGSCVQSRSRLAVSSAGEQSYGSPIVSYTVQADGKTYFGAQVTTDVLSGSGEKTVTVTATDGRGRTSAPVTETVTVLPYEMPRITLTAYRCRADGTSDPEASCFRIGLEAEISELEGQNAASYKIRYRRSPGYGWTELTGEGTSFLSDVIPGNAEFVYQVEGTVTDCLTSSVRETVIPIAFVLMDFYNSGKGVTFGRVATAQDFFCAMPATFEKQVSAPSVILGGGSLTLLASGELENLPDGYTGTGLALAFQPSGGTGRRYLLLSDDRLWVGRDTGTESIIVWTER